MLKPPWPFHFNHLEIRHMDDMKMKNCPCFLFFFLATFRLSQWSDVLLLYLECDSMTMTFRFSNFHRPPCHSFLLLSLSLSIPVSGSGMRKYCSELTFIPPNRLSDMRIFPMPHIESAPMNTRPKLLSDSDFDAVFFLSLKNQFDVSIQIPYFIHFKLNFPYRRIKMFDLAKFLFENPITESTQKS